MLLRSVVVIGVLTGLTGCGHRADDGAERTAPRPSSSAQPGRHEGTLTARERSLATAIAKRRQRQVTGTFVGATAFVTRGTPFDPGSACDVDRRFLNVRLVWEADANFTHGHPPNSPPDGPRKDLLMTVDETTQHVCETGARYRNVGAAARETLLYGRWPSPADG